jgi:hypothetical protein
MKSNKTNISRREAIKRTGLWMGGVLITPAIASLFQGCTPTGASGAVFFNSRQMRVITQMCDLMIPSTDTPGALDASVPAFIDRMVGEVYSPDQRSRFADALDAFEQGSAADYGASFSELDETAQARYMTSVTESAINTYTAELAFILIFRDLCLTGFCLSEQGSNSVLRYMQTPGKYEPCIPFGEVGKTWAT